MKKLLDVTGKNIHAQLQIHSFPNGRSLRQVPQLKTNEPRPYGLTTLH